MLPGIVWGSYFFQLHDAAFLPVGLLLAVLEFDERVLVVEPEHFGDGVAERFSSARYGIVVVQKSMAAGDDRTA